MVSPYINRFLQPDSIIPNPANPQDWNRYSYVANRPVKLTDPTGNIPIDCYGTNYCGSTRSKLLPDPYLPPKPSGTDGDKCDKRLDCELDGGFGGNPPPGHEYENDSLVCPAWVGCTEDEVKEYLTHFQYPGQWPWSPVIAGNEYIVFPARIWNIPVPIFYILGIEGLGAIIVDSKNDGLTLINLSQPTHIFHNGDVERKLYQDEHGAWRVATQGIGTNVRTPIPLVNTLIDIGNDIVGPPVFELADLQMQVWVATDQTFDAVSDFMSQTWP